MMRHWFSDLKDFQRDPMRLLRERGNASREPLHRLYLSPKPVYLVTDASLIKPILKMDESVIDKGKLVRKLERALGPSSLTISGDEQRTRRAALHQLMARGIVEQYTPEMCSVIRSTAAHLATEGTFRADEICRPLALRLISVILFGHEVLSTGDQSALINAILSAEGDVYRSMFRIFPLWPWQRATQEKLRQETRATMRLIVERVRQRMKEHSAVARLEELGLDDEALGNELLTMLVAGHHTTGGAAAWLLYFLASDRGLAEKIADEAAAISDSTGEIDPSYLRDAKVTYALVREVLRLYPSSWWFSREVKKETTIAGVRLKPGTSLIFCQWHLHRDPRYWEDPDRFDISRNFNTPAYLPFGAGPRACVGMGAAMLELQLLALEITSAFNIERVSTGPVPLPTPAITLIPPPLELSISPRDIVKNGHRLRRRAA